MKRLTAAVKGTVKGTKAGVKGFTLIEVMVALAIVGIALPALLSLVQGQTDLTGYLQEKAIAQWVAQNKMTELRLIKQLKKQTFKGKDNGEMEMAGATWNWQISTEKTPLATKFRRIKIAVTGKSSEEPLVVLEGIMNE